METNVLNFTLINTFLNILMIADLRLLNTHALPSHIPEHNFILKHLQFGHIWEHSNFLIPLYDKLSLSLCREEMKAHFMEFYYVIPPPSGKNPTFHCTLKKVNHICSVYIRPSVYQSHWMCRIFTKDKIPFDTLTKFYLRMGISPQVLQNGISILNEHTGFENVAMQT